jgi:LPS-assembly protein
MPGGEAEAPPGGLAPSLTPTPQAVVEHHPGAIAVDEIHLFFPGVRLEHPRAITVDDRIIEEARLFPDEGGVSMTIVVRRPVYYVVLRELTRLRVHVEAGTLLMAEPSQPAAPLRQQALGGGSRAPRPGRGGQRMGGVEGQTIVPRVTMPPMRKGEGLTVDAEHLSADQETNDIIAQGHVTIARAGSLLTADEVRINRETQKAQAHGNVQFTDPQGTIQAESFSGNLEDETGELGNGTVYLGANHLTISGSKLEKSFGQTYHIENGEFTTCQCGAGAPSWSIAGKSIDVTLNGYGFVENAKLKVLDYPLLPLPYLAFPAKTTRQTGLLSPLFGFSNKRGFVYTQPLFVVLNKSADLTVAPDVETSARVGGVGEFRYALDEKSKGVLDLGFYDESLRSNPNNDIVDTTIADPHIPRDRWSVTASMQHELPLGIRAFADSLAVSDDLYLREIRTYSFDPQYERTLSTSRFSSSTVGLYESWEKATLIADAIYYQDFIQEDDLTLQRLPQVDLFAADRYFDRHLKLAMDGEFVDFWRRKGFDGPRLDLAPTATVPFRWQEYFNGNLGLQLRETAYHLNNTDLIVPVSEAGGVQTNTSTKPLAKNPSRELLLATAMLGTEMSRVFDVEGEHVQKLKHTFEPEVDYLYVPDVNQDDLPIYDFTDRINRRNLFTYGFTTRLLAKLDQPPPIEVRRGVSVGDLNPFTGNSVSPFDDTNTRGGLASLGNPQLTGTNAYGTSPTTVQSATAGTPTEIAPGESEPQDATPEQRAARVAEEKSALSHVAEWARLQLFQSYDLRDSLQTKERDHFSDVDAHLRLSPVSYFNLIYDSTVNARDTRLTSASVGMLLRDPRPRDASGLLTATQRASLALSYRFISDSVLQEVDSSVIVPVADTLSVFYMNSYDALQKVFLAKIAGFRLISQCQCWIADVSVADRVNPQETEVRFQLTLIGLGSVGRAR